MRNETNPTEQRSPVQLNFRPNGSTSVVERSYGELTNTNVVTEGERRFQFLTLLPVAGAVLYALLP